MKYLNAIGDSHILRYNQNHRDSTNNFKLASAVAISGVTVAQMRRHIKSDKPFLRPATPCAIFLGTNDFKKGNSNGEVRQQYLSLLKLTRKIYHPTFLIIVTLPEFPKFERDRYVIQQIREFNQFLLTLRRTGSTEVIKWPQPVPRNYFLHKYYNGRVDLIHLSKLGMEFLTIKISETLGVD